ncbi:ATP-binding protein [Cognataquiflexum rubidum]|uniref:ATP-binding protein n=1 Tax=Cognataquiflexum rubidum TaxID=2922273 RepID=UPI001F130EFC|nr:AAA family ATPase [Cognataquiflexum rubidum]
MEELLNFQANILNQMSDNWSRYLLKDLMVNERLLGLKGLRGVGKTTILLQYMTYQYPEKSKALYVTSDHPYFYTNSLFNLAGIWYANEGKLLLIDEVHKYPNWSRELKLIYDGFPSLQVFFTSSSALDLYRGESDLSRRLAVQDLEGMSFREYLNFTQKFGFEKLSLEDVLINHQEIATEITKKIHPLPYFRTYLKSGYFPFAANLPQESIPSRIIQILNTVLETDLSFAQDYSAGNVAKIKRLLGVIAASAPFEPNISKIAEKLGLGRNTVYLFLHHLQDAKIIRMINMTGKSMGSLQKPDKIYFENPNFTYALQAEANIGAVRETFFINQLSNSGNDISLSKDGDFLVEGKYIFEVGGKNKGFDQIKDMENSHLALDEMEIGFGKKIPLWLFGFLY